MLRVPVRFAESQLRLNRKDHFDLFGSTACISGARVRISCGSQFVNVPVLAADADGLELTPADADRMGIRPDVIAIGRSTEFLRLHITLHASGKEIPYRGQLRIVPRKLYVNSIDARQLPGNSVAARTRSTVFGNLTIEDTPGMSYVQLRREEAVAALLRENDIVEIIEGSGTPEIQATLPERFLPLNPAKRPVITETDVWRAIRQRKKIWVPRGSLVTPAAMELGRSRDVFEYEK